MPQRTECNCAASYACCRSDVLAMTGGGGNRSLPGELSAGGSDGTSAALEQGRSQLLAPQVPAAVLPVLDSLPHLSVSFGNAAYFELAHNWAKSMQLIGAPFLIAGAACR
jgi:hypothetical protein